MTTDKPLINRVANSGIKVLNLEDYYPQEELIAFDLKPYLFKELILKEKDFRSALKALDWSIYQNKIVVVFNSTQAIIPVWAYMLVSAYLSGVASEVFQGTKEEYLKLHYQKVLKDLDFSSYQEDRVVIKGCSNKPVPASAYAEATHKLKPFAQSIMYGEPCSTVPIFKRPRDLSKRS
ncbi:MAG: DUF2480 family protein [Saprospiraceae bacterium]|nr:DUF2480 family protein [Saprospiraceae bacterium]